jgi:hypothetical protein
MMINKNIAIALVAASSVFGLTSAAFAGEGGAAGAASFTIDATSGKVSGVAVAASVGKQDAIAAAYNTTAGYNSAFAQGSAGVITMSKAGDPTTVGTSSAVDTNLTGLQGNALNNGASVKIGTASSDSVVTLPK